MREVGSVKGTGEVLLAASQEEVNALRLLQAAAAGKSWNVAAYGLPRGSVDGEYADAFGAIIHYVSTASAAINLQTLINELRDILNTKV